ncbi:MAG: Zn-dependent hydrolase [Rhodothermaceae bacterium]|nr:Zn-dependent hydrolase [Rhodothermaceae bacterium]
MTLRSFAFSLLAAFVLVGCQVESQNDVPPVSPTATTDGLTTAEDSLLLDKLGQYTTVRLDADLSGLSDSTRQMIPLLIEAAKAMDEVFWMEAYPAGRDSLLASLPSEAARRYARINYGPWDRLDGNAPFLPGFEAKPAGSGFYPADITESELLQAADAYPDQDLLGLYTVVRREGDRLIGVPYHEAFAEQHQRAADYLRRAAALAQDPGLRTYLELRADALLTDDYQPSDLAWMDMRDNPLDFIVGPIETYEDQLFGYKAAHEAYVLIKDMAWSERLQRYASLLPDLQRGLPVPDEYKTETPGTDADLAAYDAVYYAGDSNAGSKTIAINLPNDEEVQLQKGSRRLQLQNVMRAKFDRILIPIATELIAEDQREHVTFDAFFGNTMFHEVAHGLGIKNTITDNGTVREALRNHASALEEGKADVLGLYMVQNLIAQGEWTEATLTEHYVTFIASIFRSVRFGSSSAHGRANLARFNFFKEMGAIEQTEDGKWRIIEDQMGAAVDALSERILTLQGDGDYDAVQAFVDEYAVLTPELEASLDRVNSAGIPVDVVFDQGVEVLGLEPVGAMDAEPMADDAARS